ncbi:phage head spike fiber domain-containing protein [Bradyrhizobium symbiodeficiens]|uniref:phage head spike fiber domain-containing protein n=1 Tax=Bradyrhizobium symbiodeficiens TaxID=1404367 RepID=UPI003A5CB6EA
MVLRSNCSEWLGVRGGAAELQAGAGPGVGVDAYLYDDGTACPDLRWLSPAATMTIEAGKVYTASFFVKDVKSPLVQIALPKASFGAEAYASFDVRCQMSGVVGSSAAAELTCFPNGWLRCEVTARASRGAANQTVSIRSIPELNVHPDSSFDGANRQFLIWNCQMEEKPCATPPIVTAGLSNFRKSDRVSWSNKPLEFGSSYSVWAKGTPGMQSAHSSIQVIVELFADNSNRPSLRRDAGTGGAYAALVGGSGGNIFPQSSPVWSRRASSQIAAAFAPGDQAVAFDGLLGSVSYGVLPSVPTSLVFGAGINTTNFWWNGDVEQVAIWLTQRIPNDLLRASTFAPSQVIS